ncbi:MAG: hypothetical protein J7605_28915 [Variovorax sp.]|nr:hypothetical protein [Variovorax sp.]
MSHLLVLSRLTVPALLGAPVLKRMRLLGGDDSNSLFDYELLLKTSDAGEGRRS